MAITHAWLGAVTTTAAVIRARSDQASISATTSPATGTHNGTEGADDVFDIPLTGLTADTAYTVTVDDGADTWVATFRTAPSGAANFTFAVAGDSGHGGGDHDVAGVSPDSPAWDSIAEDAPAFLLHIGDLHYKDITTDNVAAFRSAYQAAIAGKAATMLEAVPIAYVWDDHDFGANNSDGTSASREAAQEAYRDYVPHYTLPDTEGIWQTFTWGRVRFILTDSRSDKTPKSQTDDASKSLLGATQKAWLIDLLETATEELIVLALPNPWIDTAMAGADWWAGYTTERQEIAEALEDNGWSGKALIVSADAHMLAIDSGRFSQYDPAATTYGPPVLQAGGIDAGHIEIGGPYSQGVATDSNQQYALVDIADNGTTITVTLRGVAVAGTTETEPLTYQFTVGSAPSLPESPPGTFMERTYTNASITTAASDSAAAAATIALTDATGWPTDDFTIAVWDKDDVTVLKQVVLVGSRTGTTLSSLTRGYDGTSDSDIDAGDYISLHAPALDFRQRPANPLWYKPGTPDTPDTDWATGLGNWTAVGASAGTATLIEAGAADLYDLASRPGWALLQASAGNTVELRCDYTLPDGRSIILAAALGWSAETGDNMAIALRLNNSDVASTSGDYVACMLEQDSTLFDYQANSSADSGGTELEGYQPFGAHLTFYRIARDGLTYHCFVSEGGYGWHWIDSFTFASALDNVWVSLLAQSSAVNANIAAIPWIREGSNGVDPW